MDTLHMEGILHMEDILHTEDILDTKNQDAEGTCTTTVTIPMRAIAVIDMVVLGDDPAMDQEDVVSDISVSCFRVQCWISTSSSLSRQSSCLNIRSLWPCLSSCTQRVITKHYGTNEEVLGTQACPINLGRMEQQSASSSNRPESETL